MKLQVLVTTMFAKDFRKVDEMNLRNVDVVIANQTDYCLYEEKDFPERNVHAVMISTNTRGLGLNRNILLAYATNDIIMFADDDMYFAENFEVSVMKAFEMYPDADAVKFYCESTAQGRALSFKRPKSFHVTKLRGIMSAGVPALAVRTQKLKKYDVVFPTSVGAGRFYGSGEDSVFYRDLIKLRFKIYVSPELISYIDQTESTWFAGYDEHFFESTGYIYAKLYGCLAEVAALRRAYRMSKKSEIKLSFREMFVLMKQGIKEYRK